MPATIGRHRIMRLGALCRHLARYAIREIPQYHDGVSDGAVRGKCLFQSRKEKDTCMAMVGHARLDNTDFGAVDRILRIKYPIIYIQNEKACIPLMLPRQPDYYCIYGICRMGTVDCTDFRLQATYANPCHHRLVCHCLQHHPSEIQLGTETM